MKKVVLQCSLTVLCGLSLLFFPGCKEKVVKEDDQSTPTESDTNSISVLLDARVVEGKRVIVIATFCNNSNVTQGMGTKSILYSNKMSWGAFRVTRDKKEIPYIGRYEEYMPPEGAIYDLMPGASYTARVRLHNEYDLSRAGTYTVMYRGLCRITDEKGNEDAFWICSNTVEFTLTKGIRRDPVPPISEKDLYQ